MILSVAIYSSTYIFEVANDLLLRHRHKNKVVGFAWKKGGKHMSNVNNGEGNRIYYENLKCIDLS